MAQIVDNPERRLWLFLTATGVDRVDKKKRVEGGPEDLAEDNLRTDPGAASGRMTLGQVPRCSYPTADARQKFGTRWDHPVAQPNVTRVTPQLTRMYYE